MRQLAPGLSSPALVGSRPLFRKGGGSPFPLHEPLHVAHRAFSLQSGVFDAFNPVIPVIRPAHWMEQARWLLVTPGEVSGIFRWLDRFPGDSLRHDDVPGESSRNLFMRPVAMDHK